MKNTRTFKDKILLIVKGLTMGAANKVLRVLGGDVTFAAGFYEEFIYSLQRINSVTIVLALDWYGKRTKNI